MGKLWLAQRHEDRYSVGVPDVSFIMNGMSGWIELKEAATFQERLKIRRSQLVWMAEREAAGGCCILLAQCKKLWVGIRVTAKVKRQLFLFEKVTTDHLIAIGATVGSPMEVLTKLRSPPK
jgi:hypothetical protein